MRNTTQKRIQETLWLNSRDFNPIGDPIAASSSKKLRRKKKLFRNIRPEVDPIQKLATINYCNNKNKTQKYVHGIISIKVCTWNSSGKKKLYLALNFFISQSFYLFIILTWYLRFLPFCLPKWSQNKERKKETNKQRKRKLHVWQRWSTR